MTRNNVLSIWTEDLTDMLKSLWAKGFSAGDIAAQIGVTRNTICGKIHRMGFTGPGTYRRLTDEQLQDAKRKRNEIGNERRRERRRVHAITVVRIKPVNLEALRCVEVNPQHKSLLELDYDGCRYPFGDGPFTFCNHSQHEGSSYCGPHMALSRRRTS